MDYKLKVHNPEGSEYKYSEVGNIRPNKSGNDMIGLMVNRIEPAIERAKQEAKAKGVAPEKVWLNIMMFDQQSQGNYQKHNQEKQDGYQPQDDIDSDQIPF